MRLVQHIFQLIGKYPAVPQRALSDILFRRFFIRLLLKGFYTADLFLVRRNNISVFFTGIGGLNSHQHKVRLSLFCLLSQCLQSFKIIILHIRVNGTDYNRFLLAHSLYIMQICSRQRNCRESIPSAGLHADSDPVAKLIMNCRNLGFCSCNRYCRIRIYLFNLVVHTLYHRLSVVILPLKNLDELLGAHII